MQIAETDTSLIRVWIYRSIKKLSQEEENDIARLAGDFISQWAAHGKKLAADFDILYGHYLVFYVDQNWAQATGCSIDSSVALIRQIEEKYQLGLLDRMKIGFLKNDEVVFHDFSELSKLHEEGVIKDDDKVIDALVQNKKEFDESFLTPFSRSRYK